MKIKIDESIILRLSPNEENITFVRETFEITQVIFFDDRLPTYKFIKENPEEIDFEYFEKFLEECTKIEETEINFTMNEFFYLAQTIDFVAKSFIESPIFNLDGVITAHLKSKGIDFKKFKKWYWAKSTNLFQDFHESCKNEKLLKLFKDVLNCENEILKKMRTSTKY
jgi:hypothetical protein